MYTFENIKIGHEDFGNCLAAPASLGANANMLLYTPRAQVHGVILIQKEPLLQGIPFEHPTFSP